MSDKQAALREIIERTHGRLRRYVDFPKLDRESAQAAGQRVYWADRPCRHNHPNWRYTVDARCVMCKMRNSRDAKRAKYRDINAKNKRSGCAASYAADRAEERALRRELSEVWEDEA